MNVTDYEQRRNRILELIIEAYVSTASPIGSEFVSRKLRSTLSSATIRNIMGELEEAGLLEQPHTSAGRVPTDRGYRFYVDAVMDRRRLGVEELLRGLDAEEALLARIRQDLGGEGVQVRIGREVQVPGLEECSYVTAPFTVGEEVVGGIGVLGPKRMDYPRVRALVEGMGRCMTEVLTHLDRDA